MRSWSASEDEASVARPARCRSPCPRRGGPADPPCDAPAWRRPCARRRRPRPSAYAPHAAAPGSHRDRARWVESPDVSRAIASRCSCASSPNTSASSAGTAFAATTSKSSSGAGAARGAGDSGDAPPARIDGCWRGARRRGRCRRRCGSPARVRMCAHRRGLVEQSNVRNACRFALQLRGDVGRVGCRGARSHASRSRAIPAGTQPRPGCPGAAPGADHRDRFDRLTRQGRLHVAVELRDAFTQNREDVVGERTRRGDGLVEQLLRLVEQVPECGEADHRGGALEGVNQAMRLACRRTVESIVLSGVERGKDGRQVLPEFIRERGDGAGIE